MRRAASGCVCCSRSWRQKVTLTTGWAERIDAQRKPCTRLLFSLLHSSASSLGWTDIPRLKASKCPQAMGRCHTDYHHCIPRSFFDLIFGKLQSLVFAKLLHTIVMSTSAVSPKPMARIAPYVCHDAFSHQLYQVVSPELATLIKP